MKRENKNKEIPDFHLSLEKLDKKIFSDLYIKCKKGVVSSLVRQWKISWEKGEDVFQSAMLLLVYKLKNKAIKKPFEAIEQVCAWLKKVGKNDMRNWARVRKEEPISELAIIRSEEEDSWSKAIQQITWEEINKLEEPCRSLILDWTSAENYTWDELAFKYDRTNTAIRKKYSDCRKKLEKSVHDHPDFPGEL